MKDSPRHRAKAGSRPATTRPGKWWPRLLLAVGAPAALFLGLEGALRVAGYGYPTTFFLSREANGRPVWVDNWQFAWRFMPRALARNPHPLVMPKEKAAGTIRIFVLGESAALGVPAPEYGFSRMLGALLRERFPGRKFEVINASVVAINSHAILPIARECARREGDLWVIYMGNNEVIGPFGTSGVFGAKAPPRPVIHASLALKATRVGQLLEAGLQRLRGERGAPSSWRGMQMWKEAVSRDDPRIGRVQASFRANLEAILETGRQAGLPIILSTVGCNLKDCSPFMSVHRPGLTPAQQAEWERAYQAGQASEAGGRFAEALAQYQSAARLDEGFAELQYRLGSCCLAQGRTNEARPHFQRAKDEDALQFRPDTRLNESIRQLAAAHSAEGVRLLDAEALLARSSPGGVAGAEMFYEHVHLTPAGNYLLARATAELAAGVLAGSARPALATNSSPWLTQAECEQRLGLTDRGRLRTLELVQEMLAEPPFINQSMHSNQVQSVNFELKRLRNARSSSGVRSALRKVQEALDRAPTDAELLQILAPMLEDTGDRQSAERCWREVTRLLPQAPTPYLNLAQLLGREGRDEEAAVAYEACLRRNPDTTEARGGLGSVRLRQGRPAEAIPHLRVVVRQQPHSVDGHWLLGQALLGANRPAEAVAQLKEVLRLDPNHGEARRLLGGLSGGK
jgi:tetratricopeptide (TPR) repeat protein